MDSNQMSNLSPEKNIFLSLTQYVDIFLYGKPQIGHNTSSAQIDVGTAPGFTSAALE